MQWFLKPKPKQHLNGKQNNKTTLRLILCIQNFEMESEGLKNKVAILAACLGLSGAAASLIPPCFDLMVKYRDAQMTTMLSLLKEKSIALRRYERYAR